MPHLTNTLTIELPAWLENYRKLYNATPDVDSQMRFVINAAAKNVAAETGGPFAAGVFEVTSGQLIGLGVNLVTSRKLSVLHAEILAISLAQHYFGNYNLSDESLPACQLVTSSEPCAMCLGAIPWSGINKIICGASTQDARDIGFEEGTIPANWRDILHAQQIKTETGVLAECAKKVLHDYTTRGGVIYNGSPTPG